MAGVRSWFARGVSLVLATPLVLCCAIGVATAQRAQKPDLAYRYENNSPAFAAGSGPKIVFSTRNSVFVEVDLHSPLSALAEADGFATAKDERLLDAVVADNPGILALINPYLRSYNDYPAIEPPSAFSDEEIEAVRGWVENGGSLLVIADHAPLGGGSSKLASAFGFTYLNGHTGEDRSAAAGYAKLSLTYTPQDGLGDHAITNGATGRKQRGRFHTFGGQSFIPPAEAVSLLTLPQGWSAWFVHDIGANLQSPQKMDASGMSQGAVLEYGKGRVAIFAEAGAFSAQLLPDGSHVGFNTELGKENPEFALSVLRWLARFEPN